MGEWRRASGFTLKSRHLLRTVADVFPRPPRLRPITKWSPLLPWLASRQSLPSLLIYQPDFPRPYDNLAVTMFPQKDFIWNR